MGYHTAFKHQQINEVFCFVLFFSITIVSSVKSVVFFSFSRSKSDNQMFLFSLSYHFFIFRRFIRYIANFFFNIKLHRIGTLHFLCLSIGANQKALFLKGICVKATCLSNAEINQSLKRQKRGISICKSHNGSGYAISLVLFVPFRWLKRNLDLIFRLAKCSV